MDNFEFIPPIMVFEPFPEGIDPYGGQPPIDGFAFDEQFEFLVIDPWEGGPLAPDDGMLITA